MINDDCGGEDKIILNVELPQGRMVVTIIEVVMVMW